MKSVIVSDALHTELKIEAARNGESLQRSTDRIVKRGLAKSSDVADLVAALREVEWVLTPGGPEWESSQWECPWCDFTKSRGHDSLCPRQAALAPFEVEFVP